MNRFRKRGHEGGGSNSDINNMDVLWYHRTYQNDLASDR